MEENKEFLYKLKSINSTYLLLLKIIDEEKYQKIEIKLTHQKPSENLIFLLRNTRNELIKANNCLSKFNSIPEIFNYFIELLKLYKIKIIKQCFSYYYIILFDKKKDIEIKIQIPKINDNYSEIEEIIKKPGNSTEEPEKEFEKSSQRDSNDIIPDKKEVNLKNKKIISDKKDICNCFTVFINNKGIILIFWSIKEKGILYFNFNNYNYSHNTHSHELNIINYLQDNTEKKDYIITSSPLDEEILKIWEIEEEKEVELILKKQFQNNFFRTKIDLFCSFKCDKYIVK